MTKYLVLFFLFFFTALLLLSYVLVLLLSFLSLHLYHQKGKGSLQLPVCNTSDEEAHSVLLMLTNTMAFPLDGSEMLASLFSLLSNLMSILQIKFHLSEVWRKGLTEIELLEVTMLHLILFRLHYPAVLGGV